ncbi:MFS transporter [Brachyspira intermedia]|uniref:MFS transporter n=1 Tax=Brachyspira intermedia TaxID=84377 RepID=UPI0030044015
MSKEEKAVKNSFKKWFTFCVLVFSGGTVFKLSSLKDAFYVPMQEFMNLTHTQIGFALSVYGLVQTIGNFFSIYIADRFSKRILIPVGLIGVGLVGLYMSTFPPYYGILISWGLLSLFGEVIYWPVLLKSVRLLGDSSEQGRLFSFLEAGRGIVDVVIAYSALGVFTLLGSGSAGLRGGIIFFSAAVILAGILSYILLEDDVVKLEDESGNKVSRDKAALQGVIKAVKSLEIWVVSLTIFSVYSVYCGLTYFIPFLKDIYSIPVALVGAYGIINQYGLKIVGGPIGGVLSDKVFHSPTKYIRFAFLLSAIAIVGFTFIPHSKFNPYIGMVLTLSYGAIIFSMRAVFFAPIDEVKVPREISGAAMSIACIFGYSPQMFAFTLYGNILDNNPGFAGYRIVFFIMAGFSVLGILISSLLLSMIKKKEKLGVQE